MLGRKSRDAANAMASGSCNCLTEWQASSRERICFWLAADKVRIMGINALLASEGSVFILGHNADM